MGLRQIYNDNHEFEPLSKFDTTDLEDAFNSIQQEGALRFDFETFKEIYTSFEDGTQGVDHPTWFKNPIEMAKVIDHYYHSKRLLRFDEEETLFRIISIKSIKNLRVREIGRHWTKNAHLITSEYFHDNIGLESGSKYVLYGSIGISDQTVDILATICQHLIYPEEEETTLKTKRSLDFFNKLFVCRLDSFEPYDPYGSDYLRQLK